MIRYFFFLMISLVAVTPGQSQQKTKNIIIITLDGYRWRELFEGADETVMRNRKYISDTTVWERFGGATEDERRRKLMPFFWNTIASEGQLYGNRKLKNKVNCKNWHLLSYPGYNEMLVGFPDSKVSSNSKEVNRNYTVLEFIHQQEGFENEVAAFATWDVFPYILREEQSQIYVNAGVDLAQGEITLQEQWMNEHQELLRTPHGTRYDEFTFQYALHYLQRERPRVMFIGFDETDSYAHGGKYDEYLKSAHHTDKMIRQLWNWIQSQSDYRDQTTLFITTDHGRGNGKNTWRNHRLLAPGSRHIWFAVLGPDTPPFGEMSLKGKFYQKQVAKTVATLLGLPYHHRKPVGEVVKTMVAVPTIASQKTSAHTSIRDTKNSN